MNALKCVVLMALFSMVSTISTAQAGSILGNLKLPMPYSQTGDMQIIVTARSTTTNHSRQQTLTITEAQASSGGVYGFSVFGLNDAEDYQLTYSCQSFFFQNLAKIS